MILNMETNSCIKLNKPWLLCLCLFSNLTQKLILLTCSNSCSLLLKGYSSRLAALDYTVCLFSEVFVTTQGGNFPHFLMGHRRFLFNGHAKTIKPDKRMLVGLLENTTIRYFFRQLCHSSLLIYLCYLELQCWEFWTCNLLLSLIICWWLDR